MSSSSTPTSDAPKLGVKGFSLGAKSSAKPFSITTKPRASPSSTLGKRPRAALLDDHDEETDKPSRHEAVTAFDAGVAVTVQAEKNAQELLVIPRVKNRDWREEIRRGRQGKNLLPPEVQASRNGNGRNTSTAVDIVNGLEDEPKWGLSVTKKAKVDDLSRKEARIESQEDITEAKLSNEDTGQASREKTDDERAIDALMGVETEKKGPDLVIPTAKSEQEDADYAAPRNEADAFRKAMRSAPDVSTLEDYERVPVEEFGAALLRGMGWKEGVSKVERPKDVKRRQNLLGLGAKELKGAEELGAWVQKSDPKRLGSASGGRGIDRRPRANEYREREQRRKDERDERYGGGHRRDRDHYSGRERDRDRGR